MNPIPVINDSESGARRVSYKYEIAFSSKSYVKESGTPQLLPHGMMPNGIPKILYKTLPSETIDIIHSLMKEGRLYVFFEEEEVESLVFTKTEIDTKGSRVEDNKLEELRLIANSEGVTRFRSQGKVVSSKIAAVIGYRAGGNVKATSSDTCLNSPTSIDP